MHANSIRAGYLDLDGCTVVDLLPRQISDPPLKEKNEIDASFSNFIPTCSDCLTPYPSPGVISVRGESSMATCRECHRKMS